jgi:GNAT superfamily N-acetyltransferase
MPESSIEPLSRRDEPAAVTSLAAAFADYPLFPPLSPDPIRRPRAIDSFCRYLFRMAVRAGGAFGTIDRSAVACAWPPGREWPTTWDQFRSGGLSLLWRLGWRASRLLTELERGFDAARRKHVPGPHWYVSLLGVRAEARGRGLSRAVLAPICEAADRDGVPVYLETMDERNVAIYERLGFALVGQSELAGRLPNWELRRDPPRGG